MVCSRRFTHLEDCGGLSTFFPLEKVSFRGTVLGNVSFRICIDSLMLISNGVDDSCTVDESKKFKLSVT